MIKSNSHTINISQSELVPNEIMTQYYSLDNIQNILQTTLDYMNDSAQADVILPYFSQLDSTLWQQKPKELDVYITDVSEAQRLNLEARGKNYATNILSYPSDLPPFILEDMPSLPLGELIICHDVVAIQANEQNKMVSDHVTHLLVHGILHLFGFDHEQGDTEADEMEAFEIGILEELDVRNPYL